MPAATRFDPLRPDILRDPYPLYASMRERAPVVWDEPLQSWLLTRHRDCLAILRDTQRFAADPRRAGEPVPDSALTVQLLDPPEHAPVRALLSGACRAQDMAAVRHRARQHAEQLLRRLAEDGGGELMTAFAAPLALTAICDFMGVEPPQLEILTPIGDAMMRGMDAGLRPEQANPAADARSKLNAIFDSWSEPQPEAGMIGALLATAADNGLDAVIVNSLYVVFNSGYLSVSGAIGNALVALLSSGKNLAELLHSASLDLAVEELFRRDGYVQAVNRVCVENAELGGQRIARGHNLILLLGAANRDPEQFTRPDDLVLDRKPNRHLGLGWGSHSCLGGFLARELMKIAIASVRDQVPHFQLAAEVVFKPQATVRCPDRIPVAIASRSNGIPAERL